ncbi:MAG: TatD family hydrolase [Actinomycetota bacterium]
MSPAAGPGWIDTHCHVSHIDAPATEVLAAAAAQGVDVVVDIGMGTEESTAAARRAVELAPALYATVGVHPNELSEFERDPGATLSALRRLAAEPRVVGIGETGLDTYRDRWPVELQEEAFRAQIDIAIETDTTLVIHCRDAHDTVLSVLDDAAPDRVVMHCFSGDLAFARTCAERGYFCSFAGNLTYKKNEELRTAAAQVPAELLLIETDAPFLAPEGHRGKPNSPALLPTTAAVLAEVRRLASDDLAMLLRDNTTRAFGLD